MTTNKNLHHYTIGDNYLLRMHLECSTYWPANHPSTILLLLICITKDIFLSFGQKTYPKNQRIILQNIKNLQVAPTAKFNTEEKYVIFVALSTK
jgi:hypothetical protein